MHGQVARLRDMPPDEVDGKVVLYKLDSVTVSVWGVERGQGARAQG